MDNMNSYKQKKNRYFRFYKQKKTAISPSKIREKIEKNFFTLKMSLK